jgi:RNA polymerase sigma-70 factor (ECF subfamily)
MHQDTPDSAEIDDLLEQAEAGRQGAIDRLLDRHRPYLHQLVELRIDPKLRSRIDPSDVVQEAQLEASRRLGDFLRQRPMPFRLWLRQIAYDRLLMLRRFHVRAARRTVEKEVALPERSSLLLARQLLAGSTASQQLARRELAGLVRAALGRLPDHDREVLLMRTFEGLSFEEVGYLLGIEPAAARKRHGRALIRLHKLLLEQGPGELPP